ncbi:MAG: hypothetical protein QOJ95_5840 [Mycobacterium sp.]|nr:hypothetical protein [Mycobacterium sp.]
MTTTPDQQPKRMKLRYAGTCRTCVTPLPAGTLAAYDRVSRLVTCLACLRVLPDPTAVAEPPVPASASHPLGEALSDECAAPGPDAEWVDLAGNVPGQAVRALAEAELAAMRGRSRLGTVIARAFDVKTDERAWRVGADGEETVGTRLDKLGKHGWQVLHSVPVGTGGSDIDHVVIGPGGVWTVNTKRHPGKSIWVGRTTVLVDGHRQPYLRNSRHEAERASRLLTEACGFPVPVKAALVFLTGTLVPDVTVKQAPDGVAILDRTGIPRAFRRTKPTFTDDQVATVFAQARRSTTWQTTGPDGSRSRHP